MIIFAQAERNYYDDYFSNFNKVDIEYNRIVYPTVEHAYQAQKTTDRILKQTIADALTPGLAKRYGQRVQLRRDWDDIKYKVMIKCLRQKFQVPKYRDVLLATGTEELAEEAAAWNDRVWGLGKNGDGQNLLGKALMEVRDEISGC